MTFLDSILSLLAAAFAVVSAYFFGHALSSEHPGVWWIASAVALLLAAAIAALAVRGIRKRHIAGHPPDARPLS